MSKKFAVVEKQFEYRGHDCICVFNKLGFRCGYVSVADKRGYAEYDIDCHGGLIYGAGPLPVEYGQKEKQYVGFGCNDYGDGIDAEKAKEYNLISGKEYCYFANNYAYLDKYPVRTLEYVESECKKIVDQLEEK